MEKEDKTLSLLNKVRYGIQNQNSYDSQLISEHVEYYKNNIKPALEINGDRFLQREDIGPVLLLINEIKKEIEQDSGIKLEMDKYYYGNFECASNFSVAGDPNSNLGVISSLPLEILQDVVSSGKLECIVPEIVLAFKGNGETPFFVVRFKNENVLVDEEGKPDLSTGRCIIQFGFGDGADFSEYCLSVSDINVIKGDPLKPEELAKEYASKDIIKLQKYLHTEMLYSDK